MYPDTRLPPREASEITIKHKNGQVAIILSEDAAQTLVVCLKSWEAMRGASETTKRFAVSLCRHISKALAGR